VGAGATPKGGMNERDTPRPSALGLLTHSLQRGFLEEAVLKG
jgi:hypothetical protein